MSGLVGDQPWLAWAVWLAVQVTVLCTMCLPAYALARRRGPGEAAAMLAVGLVSLMLVGALSLAAWPWVWTIPVPSRPVRVATAREQPPVPIGRMRAAENPAPPAPAITADRPSTAKQTAPRAAADRTPPRPPAEATSKPARVRSTRTHIATAGVRRADPAPVAVRPEPAPAPHWIAVVTLAALAAGVATYLLRLIVTIASTVRLRRRTQVVDDEATHAELGALLRGAGYHGRVELLRCDRLQVPATVGWRRPAILLPTDFNDWAPSHRRLALAHEVAHLVRRDYLWRVVGQFVAALYFFHPLVRWMNRRLRLEQEYAADAWATAAADHAHEYIEFLAQTALRGKARQTALLPSLPTRRSEVLRRIAMLRKQTRGDGSGLNAGYRFRLAAVGVAVLAVGIVGSGRPQVDTAPGKAEGEVTATATPLSVDDKIREALRQRVSLEFERQPLSDVADQLRDLVGANVVLHRSVIDDLGADTPVSVKFSKMTLASALAHLLAPLDLDYVVRDGVLVIATNDAIEDQMVRMVYPVGDLVGDARPQVGEDVATLWLQQDGQVWIHGVEYSMVPQPGARHLETELEGEGDDETVIDIRVERGTEGKWLLKLIGTCRAAGFTKFSRPVEVFTRLPGESGGLGGGFLDVREVESAKGIDVLKQQGGGFGGGGRGGRGGGGIGGLGGVGGDILNRMDFASVMLRDFKWVEGVHGRAGGAVNDLLDLIEETIEPESWDDVGGPGSMEYMPSLNVLVVNQSGPVQRQVGAFLEMLRSPEARRLPQWRRRMEERLDEVVSMHYQDKPLIDVAAELSERVGGNVVFDNSVLDDLGPDVPISFRMDDVPLRVALRFLLDRLDATYTLRDEALVLMTQPAAEDHLEIRFYELEPLLPKAADGKPQLDADEWRDTIRETIEPESWADVGGPAPLGVYEPKFLLVIGQTYETHAKIEALLKALEGMSAAE